MEGPWLISYAVLWVLVLTLALLALSHSRLLGLLHQRLGPGIARAAADGPALGTAIAEIQATTLFGQPWSRRFPVGGESMLVFVSPQCLACNELIPHVKDFIARFGARAEVLLLSVMEDAAMNRAYADYARLDGIPYLIAGRFASAMQIAGTPYALKLDSNGTVLAKGIVNNFEHLVSLWNMKAPPEAGVTGGNRKAVTEDAIA